MSFDITLYFDRNGKNGNAQKLLAIVRDIYEDAPFFAFKKNKKKINYEDAVKAVETDGNEESQLFIILPYTDSIEHPASYIEAGMFLSQTKIRITLYQKYAIQEMLADRSPAYYPVRKLIQLCRECADKLLPSQLLCGWLMDIPADCWIEFCRDPLYYCIELQRVSGNVQGPYVLSDQDRKAITGLADIKKIITTHEIVNLIEKNKGEGELFFGPEGTGIIRKQYGRNLQDFIYPRYFIRKEIRKRGISIPQGEAEKSAKKLHIE